MGKHALLSASSSHRWLHCPPSARLCETYADTGSAYAAEGTAAHSLCEFKLKQALCVPAKDPTEDLSYYDMQMEDCATAYAGYTTEIAETVRHNCPDAKVLIEQRLDYSRWAESGFGTADCIVVADGTLSIIDYKHGSGILVEAEDNSQMKLYALGALELFDGIYDIDTVTMTIFQPRRDNVSTSTVMKDSLYKWANETLKPTAALAYAGNGEYAAGDWCRFCRAKPQCRKLAEHNMELAAYDFAQPALLENHEIAEILTKADGFISWIADVKDYALAAALKGGRFCGYKVVRGRSNRRYTDERTVAAEVFKAGYEPFERTIIGVSAMEALLGKKKFTELLEPLIIKPEGKPVLVPVSDKRQEISINTAAMDFAD